MHNIIFGGGGRQTYPPPYKHDMTLLNLAVLLNLRLLSSIIDRFFLYWSKSKVEKTVERAIHARSTRDANFDKYKKRSLRGATGIEKVDGDSCITRQWIITN